MQLLDIVENVPAMLLDARVEVPVPPLNGIVSPDGPCNSSIKQKKYKYVPCVEDLYASLLLFDWK